MKILQSVQRYCAVLGLGLNQSVTQKLPNYRKLVRTFCILGLACCFCCAYFFIEANTFQAYSVSIYISSTFMAATVLFVICVWKNRLIFSLIDNAEQMINESEYNIIPNIELFMS